MESLRWLLPVGDPCGTLIIRSINDLVMTRRVFSITSTLISKLRYPQKQCPGLHFLLELSHLGWVVAIFSLEYHFRSGSMFPGKRYLRSIAVWLTEGLDPLLFFHGTCLMIEFEVEPVIKAQFFFDRKRISSCQCPSHNGIRSSRKLSLVTVKSCLGLLCPGILSLGIDRHTFGNTANGHPNQSLYSLSTRINLQDAFMLAIFVIELPTQGQRNLLKTQLY